MVKWNLSSSWSGGPSMIVSISPTACHACGAVLSRDGKYPKIPGASPGPHLLHAMHVSIGRRRQDVRYALLAPLPLFTRRAEIFALNIQAPGWCRFFARLPQLVGTRRGHSKAISPQFQRHQGLRPDATAQIILVLRAELDKKNRSASSVSRVRGVDNMEDKAVFPPQSDRVHPWRRFGYFAVAGKVTRPAGRNSSKDKLQI